MSTEITVTMTVFDALSHIETEEEMKEKKINDEPLG